MDFLGLGIIAVLIVVFGWLAFRAWRAKNAIVKWAGVVLAGMLTLVFALALVLSLVGYYTLYSPRSNPVANIKVAGTPEQIKRGEKLGIICVDCHGEREGKMPLSGHDFFVSEDPSAEPPPPIGAFWSANLTPGGDLKNWSDGEIIRAIREGVHKSGRTLLIMPSGLFRNLSDEDVQSLVAYLRSLPPAGKPHPQPSFNALGGIMLATVFGEAVSAQPPLPGPVKAPPAGVTKEYGEYTVNIVACRDCHGKDLAGAIAGGSGAAAPNLTKILPQWNEAAFIKFFRTGVKPDGMTVGKNMPWQIYNSFASDDELKAMFAYLKTLQPINK